MLELRPELLSNYLASLFFGAVSDVKISQLGSGCVGTGFSVNFKVDGRPQRKILKTLFTSNLGMDHFSDRAGALLLAHSHYHKVPHHVKSIDVGSVAEDGQIISVGKAKEFFILMDEAHGTNLFTDFSRMAKEENLSLLDQKRIIELSTLLNQLHQQKPAENKDSLYKRSLRSVVGGNTSIMSIIDMYPQNLSWVTADEFQQLICKTISFWTNYRFNSNRLCHVHGDFHPGNIWYQENGQLTLLDRSGQTYGEPADDLTAFSINFIFYALKERGEFSGALKRGWELFWQNYLQLSGDREILHLAPLFLTLRAMVVINPVFYPDSFFGSKSQADLVRKKMFVFADKLLQRKILDVNHLEI